MGCSSGPDIVEDGLVLYVDAASKRSYPGTGTTWSDLTSNNFHGTLVNEPMFVSDGPISYFLFDGSDERVDFDYLQPAYQTTTDFTWCVWLWYNGYAGNDIIIGNRRNSAGGDSPLVFTKLTPRRFEYYPTTFGPNVLMGQWQQVIIVKNQTNLFYYRNGELQASTTSSATKAETHPFFIAGDSATFEYANVRVSSCQIYDIAFNEEQVRQNYLSTKERFA